MFSIKSHRYRSAPAWMALVSSLAVLPLTACFESPSDNGEETEVTVPTTYAFIDDQGASTVEYGGQTVRLLLITDIQSAARASSTGGSGATPVTAAGILKLYQHVDADSMSIRLSLNKDKLHTKYAHIALNKSLHNKISPDTVIGYGVSADSLVRRWAAQIAANAQNSAWLGTAAVHVDTNDVDLSQMISKTLEGAVAFYQATSVYLAGIASKPNSTVMAGTNYTEMEHNWDEAFGYFGAARNYDTYSDDTLNVSGANYRDENSDTKIDLRSEYNFSMMGTYTARRDRGLSPQDWSGDVFKAFRTGRAIISAKGNVSALTAERKTIGDVWEKVFASNTITYIRNVKTILDTLPASPSLTSRGRLAGQWSELKAFSICIQYRPASERIATNAQLVQLQNLIGTRPIRGAGKEAYKAKLDSAFTLVKSIYGFSDAQVTSSSWLN
jgi:hypothetical protein